MGYQLAQSDSCLLGAVSVRRQKETTNRAYQFFTFEGGHTAEIVRQLVEFLNSMG